MSLATLQLNGEVQILTISRTPEPTGKSGTPDYVHEMNLSFKLGENLSTEGYCANVSKETRLSLFDFLYFFQTFLMYGC